MGTASITSSGRASELELRTRDRDCFFIDASARLGCQVELEHFVNRSDGRLLEYFTVAGADSGDVLAMAETASAIDEARLVDRGPTGGLFEFVVSGKCVTTTLADAGAIASSVCANAGVGRVVADVPAHVDVRSVYEAFREDHPRTDLVACRDADEAVPVRTDRGAHTALAGRLTDKQLEVLRTAYLSGYFSWPRRTSAEECAEALDIAQPTFSQHIRAAQQRVLGGMFEAERVAD